MTWHSPISSSAITLLVLLGLAGMAASFVWSSWELRPGSPQGLAVIALRGLVDHRGLDGGQVLLAAISAVVLLALGFAFLTKMLTVFRRRGLVTRYS